MSNRSKLFVSIVIPIYNEGRTLAETIKKIKVAMGNYEAGYEIIAVNDCSKDNSQAILDSIEDIIVLKHNVNKGYSSSLKTGIKAAEGDFILITDADGTYPVEDIPKLLRFIDKYDMVVGGRTGKNVNIPLLRRPAKWFLGKIANYIAGINIPDINSGLRVFKKEIALEFWKILPERFSFTITMTLACLTNGYDVKYIPINYHKRKSKSTIHPIKDFLGFNKIILRMCLFFRPLKIFMPLSLLVFATGLTVFLLGLFVFDRFFDITFVMATLSAIQIFILGLVAELIIKRK